MKERVESRLSYVPAVALFREDVDRLVNLLNVHDQPPTIVCGKYEFDSMVELLSERGPEPDELEIRRYRPGVSVTLRKWPSRNHVWSDGSREAEDMYLRVREVLSACARWQNRVPTVWRTWIGSWLLSGFLLVMRVATGAKWDWWVPYAPYLLVLAALLFSPFRRNLIMLKARHESPSFWRRKRDDIILLVLGALIGAAATWFLTK